MKIGEGRSQQPSLPPVAPAGAEVRMRLADGQSALKAATCALSVEGAIRCTVPGCRCECFSPGKSNVRYCSSCSHSWVPHALDKLGGRQQAPALPVEPVQANAAFDIASLVLYGCQALPIRLKILLDRLFSVLRRDEVLHVLAGFGWTHEDYARGYILQEMLSSSSESWTICSAEEEPLVLQQFLRFGETRAVALELLQQCNNNNNNNNNSNNNHNKNSAVALSYRQQSDGQRRSPPPPPPPAPPSVLKTPPAAFRLPPPLPLPPPPPCTVAATRQTQAIRPIDFRLLGGLPSHFPPTTAPSSGFINFSLANLCLPKMNSAVDVLSPGSHQKQEHPSSLLLQQVAQVRPSVKLLDTGDQDRRFGADENSQSVLNLSRDAALPDRCHKPPPPAITAATLSAAKRPWSAAAGPLSLVTQLVNPATGKKRVQCNVCLKTFCDKGALKIHFSAVHLREMHKCTVDGCNMMFSSRRSRNRHSANPNPKLHSPHYRRKMSPHDGRSALARTPPTLVGPPGLPFPLLAAFPHTNPGFDLNASRFDEMRHSDLTNNNTLSSEDLPLSLSSNHQESDDDDNEGDDDDDINISVDGELLEAARDGDRGGDVGDGRVLDLSDSDSGSSSANARSRQEDDGRHPSAIHPGECSPASSVGERKWPYPVASSTPEAAADMETEPIHAEGREDRETAQPDSSPGKPDETERMDVAEALPLVVRKDAKDEPMKLESTTENFVQGNDQVQSSNKQETELGEEACVSDREGRDVSFAPEQRSIDDCNGSADDDTRMRETGLGSPRPSNSPVQSCDALKQLESLSNGPVAQHTYGDSSSPERSPASSSNEYHSDDNHCFFVDPSGAFSAGDVPLDKENPRRCTACGKVFQNHFGVKTHYQNVHLKLLHRCTVDGCNAAFPSKRSRDRHSANANLHRKLLSTSSSSTSPSPSPSEPQEALLPAAAFHSQLIARLYAESQTLEAVLKTRAVAEQLQQQQQQQMQEQHHHGNQREQSQQQQAPLLLPPLVFPDLTNLLRARVNGQASETNNEASFDLPRP
ncbi:uncharacterized protein LOC124622079 isoform X1 [Schistocerca americana]|uniref:uncharacterized protein LOC124622079 isoform X1 n=1 Tax=Schistocerca americana TaxID=7009 RepID=UPI001F5022AC|nr:uncharacterized protein LOC124622079 isoform X1 [Schistocerca americana]